MPRGRVLILQRGNDDKILGRRECRPFEKRVAALGRGDRLCPLTPGHQPACPLSRNEGHGGGAAYEVALTPLPCPGWSLATVIPEAEFLGPVETTRRLIIGLAAGALLAAALSAVLARSVIATPLSRR